MDGPPDGCSHQAYLGHEEVPQAERPSLCLEPRQHRRDFLPPGSRPGLDFCHLPREYGLSRNALIFYEPLQQGQARGHGVRVRGCVRSRDNTTIRQYTRGRRESKMLIYSPVSNKMPLSICLGPSPKIQARQSWSFRVYLSDNTCVLACMLVPAMLVESAMIESQLAKIAAVRSCFGHGGQGPSRGLETGDCHEPSDNHTKILSKIFVCWRHELEAKARDRAWRATRNRCTLTKAVVVWSAWLQRNRGMDAERTAREALAEAKR